MENLGLKFSFSPSIFEAAVFCSSLSDEYWVLESWSFKWREFQQHTSIKLLFSFEISLFDFRNTRISCSALWLISFKILRWSPQFDQILFKERILSNKKTDFWNIIKLLGNELVSGFDVVSAWLVNIEKLRSVFLQDTMWLHRFLQIVLEKPIKSCPTGHLHFQRFVGTFVLYFLLLRLTLLKNIWNLERHWDWCWTRFYSQIVQFVQKNLWKS